MADDVNFQGQLIDAYLQSIYFRTNWALPWTLVNDMHCTECVWSVAPSLSTATLLWFYGSVMHPGDVGFSTVLKDTSLSRVYVKISFEVEAGLPRNWYGVIEDLVDQMGGLESGIATGTQQFQCYGMEKLLADHLITTSTVFDSAETGNTREVGRALTFNKPQRYGEPDRGNKHTLRIDNEAFPFTDSANPETWPTLEIINYLLKWQTPKDETGAKIVPFELVQTAAGTVEDTDQPVVFCEEKTTYEVLNQLLDRRRLTLFDVTVREDVGGDFVQVRVHSMASQALAGPGFPAAASQKNWRNLETDQMSTVVIDTSSVATVDQVIVRGARQRAVGSFSRIAQTIDEGWSLSLENEYEDAASGNVSYPTWGTDEKQKRNAEARKAIKFKPVYARFEIPDDWNFEVGENIEGGVATYPMFVDTLGAKQKQFIEDLYIEQTIPLRYGVDYSGSKIGDATLDFSNADDEMPPLVIFKNPVTDKWITAEDIGIKSDKELTDDKDNHDFSLNTRVPFETRVIEVEVIGQPQHAIAFGRFSALPDDERLGEWTYGTTVAEGMIVTLSMEYDFYTEARFPAGENASEFVRYKVINAGAEYRRDYVAQDTVVGVDTNGDLIRSDGGWIQADEAGGVLDRLSKIAEIAAEWYTKEHKITELETYRIKSQSEIELGDLVVQVGNDLSPQSEIVNAPITEIRLTSPLGVPQETPSPVLQVTTWAGELEPVQMRPLEMGGHGVRGEFSQIGFKPFAEGIGAGGGAIQKPR